MKPDYGHDDLSALKAKTEAQKIAFGPVMFQAGRALRNLGILDVVADSGKSGASVEEISQQTGISCRKYDLYRGKQGCGMVRGKMPILRKLCIGLYRRHLSGNHVCQGSV